MTEYSISVNDRRFHQVSPSIMRALVDFIDKYEVPEWGRFLSVSGHSGDVLAVYEHVQVQVLLMVEVPA